MSQQTFRQTKSPSAAWGASRYRTATQAGARSKRRESASSRDGLAITQTSLEAFIEESKIGYHFGARFQSFVVHVGGSHYTDTRTLKILFEIWEEQGRP